MVKQPAFASRRAASLYFTAEPFVVINGIRQQVKRDLVDISATIGREATELCC